MTGIGENTLAQPVKPPLRKRRACLAKLVKNRLTLTTTSAVLASRLPVLVIPPRRSVSPLERSDGTSPHQLAKAGAVRNLVKEPASAASLKAVRVSIPLMQESASTAGRHRSVRARASTFFSSCRRSDSAHLAAVTLCSVK